MIGYASSTGTLRNLDALRKAGWRLLVSATGRWRPYGFPYAIDNGAWTTHQQKRSFDEAKFRGVVAKLGAGADFIVVPDVVCGGLESLRFSERWLPELEPTGRLLLLPVQNGMEEADVRPLLGPRCGIFVGGDDEWKEASMPRWGELARAVGCYLHVGRVNSKRRIALCAMAGADSFDGTSASRFSKSLPRLERARRQTSFVFPSTHD